MNRNTLASNKKRGEEDDPIGVKTYSATRKTVKENWYAAEVVILGPSRVVYRENDPLTCGARVWIETEAPVRLIGNSPALLHGEDSDGMALSLLNEIDQAIAAGSSTLPDPLIDRIRALVRGDR